MHVHYHVNICNVKAKHYFISLEKCRWDLLEKNTCRLYDSLFGIHPYNSNQPTLLTLQNVASKKTSKINVILKIQLMEEAK